MRVLRVVHKCVVKRGRWFCLFRVIVSLFVLKYKMEGALLLEIVSFLVEMHVQKSLLSICLQQQCFIFGALYFLIVYHCTFYCT